MQWRSSQQAFLKESGKKEQITGEEEQIKRE